MSSQPPFGEIQSAVAHAPGVPVIRNVNWGGLRTLYVKEVRRFFKVQLQTISAPAITTLLYLLIFTVAVGGRGRAQGMGVPFSVLLATWLLVVGVLRTAFPHTPFPFLVGKVPAHI